jgi:hypothetical protein
MMRLGFHCGFVLKMVLLQPNFKEHSPSPTLVIFPSLAELFFNSTMGIYA